MSEQTTLYRLYGADGALLYVGISNNWPSRMKQHARDKDWWPLVRNVSTQLFDSRKEAERAEAAAIRTERPIHNVRHQDGVATRTNDVIRWACDLCGRDISDGYIQLPKDEMWRQRKELIEWQKEYPNGDTTSLGFLEWRAFFARPKPARWQVVCVSCDPDAAGGGYWIGIDRCRSWRDLIKWTAHIMGKGWCEDTDWAELLERTAGTKL